MQQYMEYICYVWTGALNCFLDMLDKVQKQVGLRTLYFRDNIFVVLALYIYIYFLTFQML